MGHLVQLIGPAMTLLNVMSFNVGCVVRKATVSKYLEDRGDGLVGRHREREKGNGGAKDVVMKLGPGSNPVRNGGRGRRGIAVFKCIEARVDPFGGQEIANLIVVGELPPFHDGKVVTSRAPGG